MKAYLIFINATNSNNNKFYNMELLGNTISVEYGRVGSTSTKLNYPGYKWKSLYNSKIKKGYTDITELKTGVEIIVKESDNKDFNQFYDTFSKYTTNHVKHNYNVEKASKKQIQEAQILINNLSTISDINIFNSTLIDLFKVIPRKMSDVKRHLLTDINNKDKLIIREQDNIDSIDSINTVITENPFIDLNIDFEEIIIPDNILKLFNQGNNSKYKIYKCYKVNHKNNVDKFNNWLNNQKNKETEYLIHGTRNPNVFSILKSGLLIRPSNAYYSGSAYGDGIYHSSHTSKSLNYTGSDNDKIFFIQNVHMGKPYVYDGWYRDGKGISKNEMNYKGVQSLGCDSLYVKPGDGLLNSEYIVYNSEQTICEYILWIK